MPLAREVMVTTATGERRDKLDGPLSMHEVRDKYTRDGNVPMVCLGDDGIAWVSYPCDFAEKFFWEESAT